MKHTPWLSAVAAEAATALSQGFLSQPSERGRPPRASRRVLTICRATAVYAGTMRVSSRSAWEGTAPNGRSPPGRVIQPSRGTPLSCMSWATAS
ncbi:hypothetical protein H340_07648 [Streptomyces mobaraensis NBRC 13819 = DSM 40847]|uniref:Uncharacterized protein n=1 Tax=Streptomyces mobaraensis (strain ATCC 29032 / DSM 40847 / JCM 4168 / NBRC 13819 / NCIMB 11159 / IPCR 16-22) TaxID=1223523 RepID=M3BNE5_STRM1|nr:hypothetical protein H340_07648 [Streptomyces mobaraensis NBRC 13819 = DSM 40847]